MSGNDNINARVLDVLRDANPDQGLKLSAALTEVYGRPPTRAEKDRVRKFLFGYAHKYPDDIYVWRNNQKVYPGHGLSEPERGASDRWKLAARPKVLTDEMKALTLTLLRRFTKFLLPPDEREVVSEICNEHSSKTMAAANWLNRIDIIPRYPPLYPAYDEQEYQFTERVILRALVSEKGFHGRYLTSKDKFEEYYPVKLLRRERVSYVLCTMNPVSPVYREYALHRFTVPSETHSENVKLIELPANHCIDYDTPDAVGGVEGPWCILKTLRFEVTGPPAQHISEMRFHEDAVSGTTTAKVEESNAEGRVSRVTMEVTNISYNYEFKTWFLGLGAFARLICAEPQDPALGVDIIADLADEIKRMGKNYPGH